MQCAMSTAKKILRASLTCLERGYGTKTARSAYVYTAQDGNGLVCLRVHCVRWQWLGQPSTCTLRRARWKQLCPPTCTLHETAMARSTYMNTAWDGNG